MGIDLGLCLEQRDAARLSDYYQDKWLTCVIGQLLGSRQEDGLSSRVDGVKTDLVFLG